MIRATLMQIKPSAVKFMGGFYAMRPPHTLRAPAMSASKSPNAPLSDDDIDALADLVDLIDERTDVPVSLEGLDGFVSARWPAARARSRPRNIFPVLFERDDGIDALFETGRRGALSGTVQAPPQGDRPRARRADRKPRRPQGAVATDHGLEGLLAELPPADARRLREAGIPPYGQLWAAGFLIAVEHWEDDWSLPADSKDEAFVDEMLDPFYVLAMPLDELSPEERKIRREDHVALAIWGAYELREFWLDRGYGLRA